MKGDPGNVEHDPPHILCESAANLRCAGTHSEKMGYDFLNIPPAASLPLVESNRAPAPRVHPDSVELHDVQALTKHPVIGTSNDPLHLKPRKT
jgi:hypothetical protein